MNLTQFFNFHLLFCKERTGEETRTPKAIFADQKLNSVTTRQENLHKGPWWMCVVLSFHSHFDSSKRRDNEMTMVYLHLKGLS